MRSQSFIQLCVGILVSLTLMGFLSACDMARSPRVASSVAASERAEATRAAEDEVSPLDLGSLAYPPTTSSSDHLTEKDWVFLAPGFLYREDEGSVDFDISYLDFDKTTVPALQQKVAEVQAASPETVRVEMWSDILSQVEDNVAKMN
jgi:hypothetical protein